MARAAGSERAHKGRGTSVIFGPLFDGCRQHRGVLLGVDEGSGYEEKRWLSESPGTAQQCMEAIYTHTGLPRFPSSSLPFSPSLPVSSAEKLHHTLVRQGRLAPSCPPTSLDFSSRPPYTTPSRACFAHSQTCLCVGEEGGGGDRACVTSSRNDCDNESKPRTGEKKRGEDAESHRGPHSRRAFSRSACPRVLNGIGRRLESCSAA